MLDNSKARKVVGIFVEPVAKFLLKLGLTPNSVTLIGTAGISVSALVFFPRGEFFVGTLVILLFVFSDLIDGNMARISGRINPAGAFLDSTLDRVTDAALFSAVIIYYANIDSWFLYPALIAGVSAQLTSYVKAKAESLDITINSGIAERAERIILLLVGTGFQALGLDFALNIAILTLAVLSTITVLQRLVVAYQSEQLK